MFRSLSRFIPLALFFLLSLHAQSPNRTISVSPSTLNFGDVVIGSAATRIMQISNTGKVGVKISAITSSTSSFAVTLPAMPHYLGAGSTLTINLAFMPSGTGTMAGNISVISNASNSPSTIIVTGTGVPPATVAPLAISTSSLPQGMVQATYGALLAATGGKAPFTWSLASGTLPSGVVLQSTGSLSGTPMTAGNFIADFMVQDAAGTIVTKQLAIAIAAASDAAGVGYGHVGDPYEGSAPPAATLISTCQTLAPNVSYRLSRDLNALTAADVCLQISGPNTTIDLNGYRIGGRIIAAGSNINGTHIFNGTVECAEASTTGNAGCIWLYGDNRVATNQVRLHHLSVRNAAACSRAIHVEWTVPGAYAEPFLLRLHNLTTVAASGPTCSRTYNLSILGSDFLTAQVDHNDLTCPADSGACQGVVFYGTNHNQAHHNRIELMQNSTAETARGVLCDKSDYCEVRDNLVIANNNRAFRVRDSTNAWIHNNTVSQITCCGSAAVHLGDPDVGSNDLNAVVENNYFEVRDGLVVTIRSAYNAWFRGNTIACVGCSGSSNLARLRNGLSTSLILENNSGATSLPSPQIFVESATSASVCQSGQATGSGTITYPTSCP